MLDIKLKDYLRQTRGIQLGLLGAIIGFNLLMVLNSFFNIRMTNYIIEKNLSGFLKVLAIVIVTMMLASFISYIRGLLESKSVEKISNLLREDYLNAYIESYEPSKLSSVDTGISNLTNDVNFVIDKGLLSFYNFLNLVLGAVFPLIGAALIHYSFIIVFPLSLLIMVLGMSKFSPMLQDQAKEKSLANEGFVGKISDFFQGFATLFAYNSLENFTEKVSAASIDLEKTNKNYNKKSAGIKALMMVLMVICQFFYVINAGFLVVKSIISPGSIIGLMSLAMSFYSNSQQAMSLKIEMDSSKPVVEKLLSKGDEEKTYREIPTIADKIILDNVTFSYPNTDEKIFNNFSATYEMGKKYLVAGKSGSGKSTLLKLISKRLDNYQGSIYYDQVNIKDISFANMSNIIAYIDQNPYIFNDTIKNNITLGRDVSEDLYNKSIKMAGLEDYILGKEEGDNFILEKNGQNLSGGQKQRLVLARAYVYNKKIYLIDEAFQGVDLETAKELENTLLSMNDISLFMISHQDIDKLNPLYDEIIKI